MADEDLFVYNAGQNGQDNRRYDMQHPVTETCRLGARMLPQRVWPPKTDDKDDPASGLSDEEIMEELRGRG